MLKKIGFAVFILVDIIIVALIGAYFYVQQKVDGKLQQVYQVPELEISPAIKQADVKLGERIVKVRNGCIDCHGENLGGKTVMENGAMGKIYANNLTPAALKDWTDQELAQAIRHGVGKDQHALILMPSHDYIRLSKDDLAATIAYLRSVPEVAQPNQNSELGPVAKALLAFEQAPSLLSAQIIDHQTPFHNKPAEAVSVEFGAYLAQSACAGCHQANLKGGPIPGGAPDWPPAADLTQIKSWGEAAFSRALHDGVRPDQQQIKEPMPHFKFDETETKALWAYLQTL